MFRKELLNIGCFGLVMLIISSVFAVLGKGHEFLLYSGLICCILFLGGEVSFRKVSFRSLNDTVMLILGVALFYRYLGLLYNEWFLFAASALYMLMTLWGLVRIIFGFKEDPWIILIGIVFISFFTGQWLLSRGQF